MAKRDEGKKYKEQLLALVAEDKRALVAEALGAEQIEDSLGEHILMRSDYSKKLDEVRTAAEKVNAYNGSLTDWYTQNQAALTEAARLKEENELLKAGKGGQREDPDPDPDQTASLRKMTADFIPRAEAQKILDTRLAQQANDLVGYSNSVTKIAMQHYANFNEQLDTDQVVQHALKTKKDIPSAYGELFKDRYEEKATKETAERDKKREAELRQKIEAEIREKNPGLPYQVSMDAGLSPILEAMKAKEAKTDTGIGAAVDEFYRMQRPQ